MTGPEGSAEPVRPLLRVVRGEPTAEELAALVAVLTAGGGAAAARADEPRGQWRSRGRNIRPSAGRGPDAWRASGFPR